MYKYVLKTIFNFPYLFKEINIVCLDENVKKKLKFFKNNLEKTKKKVLKIYFNPPQFVNLIDQSNLIIVTGGGITHEINARRKKMNIISIAKNQILQSKKRYNTYSKVNERINKYHSEDLDYIEGVLVPNKYFSYLMKNYKK